MGANPPRRGGRAAPDATSRRHEDAVRADSNSLVFLVMVQFGNNEGESTAVVSEQVRPVVA